MEPELQSIEAFAEYLIDDERETFTLADCQMLGRRIHLSNSKIRIALESYGFRYTRPEHSRIIRGFTSNNNDRWQACNSHGGSGGSSIGGLAGHPERTN